MSDLAPTPIWDALGLDAWDGDAWDGDARDGDARGRDAGERASADRLRAPVVAVVGGGGKTTLTYRLAREAAMRGRRAIVTGTTRFTAVEAPGEMPALLRAPQVDLPAAVLTHWAALAPGSRGDCVVVAGEQPQSAGRLDPLDVATVDLLARLSGVGLIAVEADGSRARSFKAPAEHEPVIPASATHVVAVVGADALDAPLEDGHVHRPERVREILGHDRIRAVEAGATCDAEMIAAVLAHPEGGRKGVEDRVFVVLVNKADIDLEAAVRLARAVREAGVPRVVIAALREDGNPVREVLTGEG